MEKHAVMNAVARDVQALFVVGLVEGLSDEQLLARFVERRESVVFEVIVRRHGPMIWGVCRRVLRDHHDAEDAFQATFLVLARKAASVLPREKFGNWLYGVAYQTAMKARGMRARRRVRESHVPEMPEPMAATRDLGDDLADSLDRELSGLPERYRIPIVLCDLEGRTHREAAAALGWPVGTVSSRLSRARAMLARRLSRRGIFLSAGSLAALLTRESASAAMPARLIGSTAEAASLIAAGGAATAGAVPAKVAILTGEVMKMMLLSKIKIIAVIVLVGSALVTGGTRLAYRAQGSEPAEEKSGTKGQDPHPDEGIIKKNQEEARRKAESQNPPFPPEEADQPIQPASSPAAGNASLPLPFPSASDDAGKAIVAPPTPVVPAPGLIVAEPAAGIPETVKPAQADLPPIDAHPVLPETTTVQDQHAEDALADLIVAGNHTPEQLERAKELIEMMMTLEKEASGKSAEELDKMIQEKANDLERSRWMIRVMDAQLRRLKAIRQTAPRSAPDQRKPSIAR